MENRWHRWANLNCRFSINSTDLKFKEQDKSLIKSQLSVNVLHCYSSYLDRDPFLLKAPTLPDLHSPLSLPSIQRWRKLWWCWRTTPPWRRPPPPAPLGTSQPGTSPSRTSISMTTTWRGRGFLCSVSMWSATTGRQVRSGGAVLLSQLLSSEGGQFWEGAVVYFLVGCCFSPSEKEFDQQCVILRSWLKKCVKPN